MRIHMRYVLPVFALAGLALLPGPASAAPNAVTLITSGLDSPRGITFFGNRAVVAESGHGGPNCLPPPDSSVCIGNTSQVSWVNVKTGTHTVLAGGFFSISLGAEGTLGMSGLTVSHGKIYGQIGATSREAPPNLAIAQQAGHLMAIDPRNGDSTSVASVGDFDFDYTLQFTEPTPHVFSPGTQEHDANPTGVHATERGFLVADSGSNTLTRVGKDGKLSVVFHFLFRDPNPDNFPSDEVPTCVTTVEETVWVGTLAGHLFRFDGSQPTQVTPTDASGKPVLTHVTGCTASEDGTLYIVNMFGGGTPFVAPTFFNGNVVRFKTATGAASVLADAFSNPLMFLPYNDVIGPDGNLYVTTGAICDTNGDSPTPGPINPCTVGNAKGGRVVKIALPHGEDE